MLFLHSGLSCAISSVNHLMIEIVFEITLKTSMQPTWKLNMLVCSIVRGFLWCYLFFGYLEAFITSQYARICCHPFSVPTSTFLAHICQAPVHDLLYCSSRRYNWFQWPQIIKVANPNVKFSILSMLGVGWYHQPLWYYGCHCHQG